MRNVSAFFLGILFSLISLCWPTQAQSKPDLLDHLGVVYATDPALGGRMAIGSAFAVKGDDHYKVITAQHVGLVFPVVEICTVEDQCIFVDPKVGVGPVISEETEDDWVYWRVDELPDGLRPLKPANELAIQDEVCALGNPVGRIGEVTCGAITNLTDDIVHFDATVLPGNSGGPLINSRGQVVGIVVAIEILGDSWIENSAKAVPITSLGL